MTPWTQPVPSNHSPRPHRVTSRITLGSVALVAALTGTWSQWQEAAAMAPPPGAQFTPNAVLPPRPANPRNLNYDRIFRRSLARGARTTIDHRLRVACGLVKGCFVVDAPERADKGRPWTWDRTELSSAADQSGGHFPLTLLHASNLPAAKPIHTTLCEGFEDTEVAAGWEHSPTRNPKLCQDDDCYDLTAVSVVRDGNSNGGVTDELWSVPMRVRVSSPKTTNARVTSVVATGPPQRAPIEVGSGSFQGTKILEPNITADGRVIFVHGGRGGIMYSVRDETAGVGRCDTRAWTQFRPISDMHEDPAMSPYGVAHFRLRDTEGVPYSSGEIIRGAYPWVDEDGANLFFARASARPPTVDPFEFFLNADFPALGVGSETPPAQITGLIGDVATRTGMVHTGLWTGGKIVHLDSRLMPSTYGLWVQRLGGPTLEPDERAALGTLYTGDHLRVRLYSDEPEGTPIGSSIITMINSLTNSLNYLPYMRPVDTQDVHWLMSVNRVTAQVRFDDSVNPNALVVSKMVPTMTQTSRDYAQNTVPFYRDGYRVDRPGPPFLNDHVEHSWSQEHGFVDPPHLQNSATPKTLHQTDLRPPAYGELLGGARVEPVAAGGISAKGVYLDGIDDRIEYAVAASGQNLPAELPWFVGLWVNPSAVGNDAALLRLQNGFAIDATAAGAIRISFEGRTHTFAVPPSIDLATDRWTHLGLRYQKYEPADPAMPKSHLELFVDGFLLGEVVMEGQWFRLEAGTIVVGYDSADPGRGAFAGWIDEFKLIQGRPNLERMCTHAYGTLVGANANGTLYNEAGAYPPTSHATVSSRLSERGTGQLFQRYYCEREDPDFDIHLQTPPNTTCIGTLDKNENVRCVGRRLNFPEGPLFANRPRPDSASNSFCTSCHTPDHGFQSMNLAALTLDSSLPSVSADRRRQPTQPPPRVFGQVPSIWQGAALPAPDGILTDPLVLGDCTNAICGQLRTYHLACTGPAVARTASCAAAIHRACVERGDGAGLSQEFSALGIGVACFQAAEYDRIDLATLTNRHAGCNTPQLSQSPVCMSAIHRECVSRGHDAGVAQEVLPDAFEVACLNAGWSGNVAIADLEQHHPGCNSPTLSQDLVCVSAVHRECLARGYSAGIAQEIVGEAFKIACFNASWFGLVPF